jgi:hypothetical protein
MLEVLMQQLGQPDVIFGLLIGIMIIIISNMFVLPFLQALFAYEKKKWLERQFAGSVSSGEVENGIRAKLLEAAKPGQSYPIYKIFKFRFASTGIILIILGLLIMLIPDSVTSDAIDWVLFIPLIVGGGLFYLYHTFFKDQGLWKEIAAVFLFVGFLSTTLMAYGNFNMYEWLRADILSFIILAAGWFIIYITKSSIVSYIYMVAVAVSGVVLLGLQITGPEFGLGHEWLYFLPHLLWVFGIAILYFWIPQLRAAKDIGPKEIIFGLLFAIMILTLSVTQLSSQSGLFMAGLAVVLPGLYVFSKAYFQKANSIIGKPIELIVILIVIAMAAVLSVNVVMTLASDSIFLFEHYSFSKQISYFVIVGLIGGIFYISNDLGDASEDINPLIAFFPLGAFIIAYIFGEYGGHYMMTVFLLGAGFLYVQKGIKKKDSLRLVLGATVFVLTLIIKITDMSSDAISEQLMEGNGKFVMGFFTFLYGAIFLGSVVYMRSRWTVSNAITQNNTVIEPKNDVVDDTNIGTPSEG